MFRFERVSVVIIGMGLLLSKLHGHELPEAYRKAKILPFNDHGWYFNGPCLEELIKEHHVTNIVEVGSWLGRSTRHMASLLPDEGKVYAVDHWLGSGEEHKGIEVLPQIYEIFLSNAIQSGLAHKIIPIRMDSISGSKFLAGKSIDLAYIDGDHSTEAVYLDLVAWYPFVKDKGILCGDDALWPTVMVAVNKFAAENNLSVQTKNNFWILQKKIDDTQSRFTEIYEKGAWGAKDFSGSGSTIESTLEYVTMLKNFMKSNNIRSVVDLGCGDWQFSKCIDWEGIDYLGIDVVPHMIEKANRNFAKSNIRFLHANGSEYEMPSADLLICKDVLQHLPNKEILKILAQLPKYKYCLLTNDANPITNFNFNQDIPIGDYRPLDLSRPPFNLVGSPILHFFSSGVLKQVFLVTAPSAKGEGG